MSKLSIEVALKIIPDFDGSSEQLHNFLKCCEIVNDPLSDAEKVKLLKLIPCKLNKKPYDLCKYNDNKTFEELREDFQKHVAEVKTKDTLRLELSKTKQKESIRDFADRIDKLLLELNNSYAYTENERKVNEFILLENSNFAHKAFVTGLRNSKIQLIIEASRFSSTKESVECAIEKEMQHFETFVAKPLLSNSNVYLKCEICNRSGHVASKCYTRRPLPSHSYRPSNNFSQSTIKTYNQSQIICAYCKNIWHHINDCKKQQFNNNRNNNSSQQQPQSTPFNQSWENRNAQGNSKGFGANSKNTPHRIQNPNQNH